MWRMYRLFLIVSVCMASVLTGCAPIQPQEQGGSQAAIEPTATAAPQPAAASTPTAPAAPPPPPSDTAPPPTSAAWREFVDEARGLSIFYPPGWIFVDPTMKELTELLAEADELADSDEVTALLATFTAAVRQGELFVGSGFQYDAGGAPDPPYLNNVTAVAVPYEGLSLHLMTQMVAAQLDGVTGIAVESAEVVVGLRPDGAEALSIRYRADGALYRQPDLEIIGWQVGTLAPDRATMLILTFSTVSEDFAALQPLLGEIVQRLQWVE